MFTYPAELALRERTCFDDNTMQNRVGGEIKT